MLKFKSYLKEQVESAFISAQHIAKYLTGNRKERYLNALDMFDQGMTNKEIYNADFKDNYSFGISRGIEDAYDALYSKIRDSIEERNPDIWGLNLNSIKKVKKIYDTMQPQQPEMNEFLASIEDLPSAIKQLKTYIVMGRKPTAPKPGQFIKPVAKLEARKFAAQFLTESAQSFKVQYEKVVTDTTHKDYQTLKTIHTLTDLKDKSASVQGLATLVCIIDSRKDTVVLKPNTETLLDRIIREQVNNTIDGFIGKNTDKLALIFEKKPSVKTHKILKTTVSAGVLENTMFFEFEDNSSFEIHTQVISKYMNEKYFYQFPTRFTNVKLADGSRMSSPSEEKMIKEF